MTITYDDAGNPLSYNNGSAYTLTWQNGRELATATKNGVTSSYKYNIDGQRVQKTVGDLVYEYYYADGLLVRQTWGNNYIDFLYDESGVFSFVYNGVQYYYIKNLQGDVVAIANAAGTILVEYAYDAWGDVISITGTEANTIGAVNPIRYRGYYFDTDTEFYYLNSRYYDPEIRRFINADGYVSTGQGFVGYNMYTYCLNNPVIYADYTGEDAASALHTWTTTMWWLTTIDGPVPVGDIVYGAGILILGALSIVGIGATSSTISVPLERVQIKQEAQVKEKEKEAVKVETKKPTVIYRYGGTNPGNLTPKQKDQYTGLSFSTIYMPGAAMTTIESLNATGLVYAIKDGPNHVSVIPIGGTVLDWINAGSSSVWTAAVKSVVVKS